MKHPPAPSDSQPPAGFLRSGGWIVVLGLLATGAAVLWSVARWLGNPSPAIGDGRTVASYGFTLEPCQVPRDTLVASGMPRDGLHAMVAPPAWDLATLDARARRRGGRHLVGSDRVVGVTVNGESRAYPLRFLAWHEVANDTLGGVPIAVTYHPLCDSVVVVGREVDGEVLELAVSGLLSNSNLLLYDRRPNRVKESLWGQIALRAVAGPAAASSRRLEPLAATVQPWAVWRREHPAATLLAPDPRMVSDYRRSPYGSYFGSDLLRYPVDPLPPVSDLALKTPIIVARVRGRFHAFAASAIAAPSSGDRWSAVVDGVTLRFRLSGDPPRVWIEPDTERPAPVIHAFLFAWYAAHGDDTVWHGPLDRSVIR